MSIVSGTVELASGTTPFGAWVARPDDPDGSAVVVVMEAFGVNEHIRDVCDRFARRGSLAIAPDLYHRRGSFLTGEYADPAAVMAHFATLTTEQLADDLGVTLAGLPALGEVASDRVGVIGFCLGGYVAVLAACRFGPAAVAGFYGAGLTLPRDGSPLDPLAPEFAGIRCPVQLFYGADDPHIPAAEIDATREALTAAGVGREIAVYPGAGHGFFCDERASYVPEAATDAWSRVLVAFDVAWR